MLDDGINAFSMEYQPEEFYKNQPADIQECFDAYGVENYVELLGKNDAPGSWYPMYSYSDSIPTTSECGKVKNNLEAVKKRWLPQVIMADDFDAAWDQYMEEYNACTRGEDPKLSALTGDIRELPPRQPYDAMVFCLFGGTEETLAIAARQCGGTALVVRRDFRRHQFSSGVRMAGHTAADMERELQRRGLTYTARRFTLEFGQPFLSLDDAQAFFRLYSRDGAVPSRQELAQRLELSAWADYPLYLPNPKPLCLLAIPAAQLREEMYG